MVNYESLEKHLKRLSNRFTFIALLGVFLNLVLVAINFTNKSNSDKTVVYTQLETCIYGMRGIFENNPDPTLVNDTLIAKLGDRKFEYDKIVLVKLTAPQKCDVLFKVSKGIKSYSVKLAKSNGLSFKISNVNQQKLVSKYQWEGI
ncbi:MAG: hypothetical protein ACPGJV_12940 [Bacteriovoracaceae bacterium]